MNGNGSGLCPEAGFSTGSAETSDSITKALITVMCSTYLVWHFPCSYLSERSCSEQNNIGNRDICSV